MLCIGVTSTITLSITLYRYGYAETHQENEKQLTELMIMVEEIAKAGKVARYPNPAMIKQMV